jgi:hypothetical protein
MSASLVAGAAGKDKWNELLGRTRGMTDNDPAESNRLQLNA